MTLHVTLGYDTDFVTLGTAFKHAVYPLTVIINAGATLEVPTVTEGLALWLGLATAHDALLAATVRLRLYTDSNGEKRVTGVGVPVTALKTAWAAGATDTQLLAAHPALTQEDLDAVWVYLRGW